MDMEKGAGVEPVGEPLQGSGSSGGSGGGQQGVKHLPERWVEVGSRDWTFPPAVTHLADQLQKGWGGRMFNKLSVFRLKCFGLFLITTVSHVSITSNLGLHIYFFQSSPIDMFH